MDNAKAKQVFTTWNSLFTIGIWKEVQKVKLNKIKDDMNENQFFNLKPHTHTHTYIYIEYVMDPSRKRTNGSTNIIPKTKHIVYLIKLHQVVNSLPN